MYHYVHLCLCGLLFAPVLLGAEEFSFDLSKYEKKPYEFNGHLEFSGKQLEVDQGSAFYALNFPQGTADTTRYQGRAALELGGVYRFEQSALQFRAQAEWENNHGTQTREGVLQEAYYSLRPNDQLNLDIGKRVLKWGKGYAWNPVAFVERLKDSNDPELSREGFILVTADYVRSFEGDLKTLAFTPVMLPVKDGINNDFGKEDALNIAAKLYFLYHDTDIDLLALGEGSRGGRIGISFSRNLFPNLEIHGEVAAIQNQTVTVLNAEQQLIQQEEDSVNALMGLRYLSDNEITWIAEYYHQESGYSEAEMQSFFNLLEHTNNTATLELAEKARRAGYGKPNPMQDYLYLRASKKEPFDILYLSSSLSSIVNLQDQSFSLIPELIYTRLKDSEARLRMVLLKGDAHSEFGEKQNDVQIEFRFRYFF